MSSMFLENSLYMGLRLIRIRLDFILRPEFHIK